MSEAVPGDVRLALQRLASRGLVTTADGGWICAHDLIGERALQDLSAPANAALHSALGRVLSSGATRLRAVQLAARHLELGHDEEGLIDLAARFVDRRRAEGSRAHATKIAAEAIGIEATRRIAPRLLRQRPWHERLLRPLAAAAIVLLTGATITTAVASAGRDTSILVVAQRPLALKAQTGRAITLAPPLVVEARRSRDSTRLTISDTISFLLLDRRTNRVDTTVRTMNGGRVEFVDVVGSTDVDAGVNFPQDAIVLSRRTGARTSVRLAGSKGSENTLRLVSFALDGATLTATRRTLRAPPNTFVHGWLRVEYATYGVDETIVYAATPTWGRPEREGFAIGVLSTPTVGRQRTDSLGFRTPTLPGDYYMILVAGTETDALFLLSQTNWVLRTPVWHDGNDIAAWSPAQIDQSIRSGYVEASILRLFQGKRVRLRSQVSATAFRVIVDPKVRGLTVE